MMACVRRKQLFTLMNNEPTLFEIVTGKRDTQAGKRSRSVATVRNTVHYVSVCVCVCVCDLCANHFSSPGQTFDRVECIS